MYFVFRARVRHAFSTRPGAAEYCATQAALSIRRTDHKLNLQFVARAFFRPHCAWQTHLLNPKLALASRGRDTRCQASGSDRKISSRVWPTTIFGGIVNSVVQDAMNVQTDFDILSSKIDDVVCRLQLRADRDDADIIGDLSEVSQGLVQLKGKVHRRSLQDSCDANNEEISLGAVSPFASLHNGGESEPARETDFVIPITGMGYELATSLSRYGPDFSGKIHVLGLGPFDLSRISSRLAQPPPNSTFAIQHSSTNRKGVSKLQLPQKADFQFPDFSGHSQSPPSDYEKEFDRIVVSPPRKSVVYYVGPPLAPDFNTLLSSGKLLELGGLPGVTTPYWHAGAKDSGTAFHHEDGAVRSCNVTIAGFKMWILIRLSSNARFEEFVETLYPSAVKPPRCSQWLRHLNLLISPEELTEMDIGFDLILAGPGDMVVTSQGQYHAVINLTACFAISINFALPGDPVLQPTIVCSHCGLYKLKHSAIQKLNDKQNVSVARSGLSRHGLTPRRVKTYTSSNRTRRRLQAAKHQKLTERLPKPVSSAGLNTTTDIDEARSQQETVQEGTQLSVHDEEQSSQLSSAGFSPTSTWQTRSSSPEQPRGALSTSIPTQSSPLSSEKQSSEQKRTAELSSAHTRAAKRPRICPSSTAGSIVDELRQAESRCNIPSFDLMKQPEMHIIKLATSIRTRHALNQFYSLVRTKRDLGLQKILFPVSSNFDPAQRLRILTGLECSKIIRNLNQYLFAALMEKERDGSLRTDPQTTQSMKKDSGLTTSQYDYHLRRGKNWRRVCGTFEGMLCFIPPDTHNPFKVSPAQFWHMNDSELAMFHQLLDDDYTRAIFTAGEAFQQSLIGEDVQFMWETEEMAIPVHELPDDELLPCIRPILSLTENQHDATAFPDWPDPTVIPSGEKQCDYCPATYCDCHSSRLPLTSPRIMAYPGKGLGLQAVCAEAGKIVYPKGKLIGFLTGKLVPPDTLSGDRVVSFHKSQIDCGLEGSNFRLMNHACAKHAVARMTTKRVSGRYRLAIVAQKDIHDGAEITIVYNEGNYSYTCAGCAEK